MSAHEAPPSAGTAPVAADAGEQVQDDAPSGSEDTDGGAPYPPPEATGTGDRQPEDEAAGVPPADDQSPLPALDELVARIPAVTRQLVDELFRAKFIKVQRVDRKHLKA